MQKPEANSNLCSKKEVKQLKRTYQKKMDDLKQDYEYQINKLQNKHQQGIRVALIISIIALVLHL